MPTTILVLSILNPQPVPSKARVRSESRLGVALPHPRSDKMSIIYCTRKGTDQCHVHIVPSSYLRIAGSHCAVGEQTQNPSNELCGVGPSISGTALPNSSEGLERVDNAPSSLDLLALSVPPVDFHAQHFTKPSGKSDHGCGRDVWVWFWPVESKDSPTPLGLNEPILTQRPKAPSIACRLCWLDKETWKAYKRGDSVMSTLRHHLKTQHNSDYENYLWTDVWEVE